MKTFVRSLLFFTVLIQSLTGLPAQSAQAVEKVSLTVADLEQAVDFYTDVLTFHKVRNYELTGPAVQQLFDLDEAGAGLQVAVLQLGDETIELMQFSGAAPGRAIPPDSRSNDLWFQHIAIVVSDMEAAYKRVFQHQVTQVSTAPQTLPAYIPNAAGISAFYFRDSDGHNLELIHFPRKKGDPKWQKKAKTKKADPALFLGVDHTAIGIDQTNTGYAFWRDVLGLRVAGHSENYGTEQEHLNQVFGARLLITGLRAEAGFGVEFLDYLAPPGGRSFPADSKATDLWHWHTTLRVTGLAELYQKLQEQSFTIVSRNIVSLDDHTKALLVRDADGHAVLLEEKQATDRAMN